MHHVGVHACRTLLVGGTTSTIETGCTLCSFVILPLRTLLLAVLTIPPLPEPLVSTGGALTTELGHTYQSTHPCNIPLACDNVL